MNRVNNARSAASKQAIKQAFVSLLDEKIPAAITVQEVCQLAGINRSTFYAHYTNINELLNELELQMFKDAEQSFNLSGVDINQLASSDTILRILQFIRQHESLYRKYFTQLTENSLMTNISDEIKQTYVLALSSCGAMYSPEEIEYRFEYSKQGSLGIIKKWLLSGCNESEEYIAQMMEKILLKSLP